MTPKPIAVKREEALVRQSEYHHLTVQQRINRARSRPGNSARELARLEKKLKKGDEE